jgi:hypothetical protein
MSGFFWLVAGFRFLNRTYFARSYFGLGRHLDANTGMDVKGCKGFKGSRESPD